MHILRRLRLKLAVLCVAAFHTLVPLAAYAHMAARNVLTLHLCSASGERRVVSIDYTVAAGSGQAVADRHDCCPGVTPPPVCSSAVLPGLPMAQFGALKVGQIFYQSGAPVHVPPATGPPA